MRILIVSYFFPPFNQVGAVRVGKYAKYLHRMGHEVRVLTCKDLPLSPSLQVELEQAAIERTSWLDVNWPVSAVLGRKRVQAKGFEVSGNGRGWLGLARRLYRDLIHFPDAQIGWYPYARKRGMQICRSWRPDVIYASALPMTALMVASALARRYQVPWIAEFRDLWADNHNRDVPTWRCQLEQRLERRVVSSASGLVTVSEPLAKTLSNVYPKLPMLTLPNGFDHEDFSRPLIKREELFRVESLNLLYTGMIYPERYDLATFFQALVRAGPQIHVHFFGRYIGVAEQQAAVAGVAERTHCYEPVSYDRSIALQRSADILLIFLWNDSGQKGIYTGKLFEYLAARRPILAIGGRDSAPARLILERNAGLVSENPVEIASWLGEQLRLKAESNEIPMLPPEVAHGFERAEQVRALVDFILKCLSLHEGAKG
jgi:glycosyltransferase involved in cell wall biosynthesis